jgi:hypothetical protein
VRCAAWPPRRCCAKKKRGAPTGAAPPPIPPRTMPEFSPTRQPAEPAGLPERPLELIPPEVPQTRCPYEVWHGEAYLIACLTRHHGWFCTAPGRLEKWRRPSTAAPAAAQVQGAA